MSKNKKSPKVSKLFYIEIFIKSPKDINDMVPSDVPKYEGMVRKICQLTKKHNKAIDRAKGALAAKIEKSIDAMSAKADKLNKESVAKAKQLRKAGKKLKEVDSKFVDARHVKSLQLSAVKKSSKKATKKAASTKTKAATKGGSKKKVKKTSSKTK